MFDNDDYDAMFGSTTTTTTDDSDDYNVRRWKLGDHRMKPTVDAGQLREDAIENEDIDDDLADILSRAATQVEQAQVRDFQCPVCGLSHGHSDDKHDIRSSLGVTEEFAEMMRMNPACHCGVNELAVLVDFYGYIIPQVFEDDEQFVPFEEMMPSDEADAALKLLGHPDVTVSHDETHSRAGRRASVADLRNIVYDDGHSQGTELHTTTGQALTASRLSNSEDMRESLKALHSRFSDIRSAANSAPIPKDTEAELDELRTRLTRRAAQE
jgi:hypothetical protein